MECRSRSNSGCRSNCDSVAEHETFFKKATRKVIHAKVLSTNRSVQHRFVASSVDDHQYRELHSGKGAQFAAKVLNSPQLMFKTAQLMKPILRQLMNLTTDASMEDIARKLTGTIFEVKQSTILACWTDHLRPLEKDLQNMSTKYTTARGMLHDARSAYLQEVAHLRNSVRCRDGSSSDIVWFFEPTQALDHEEKKFVLDVVREKLRMIAENNPKIVQTWNLGQVDQLLGDVYGPELTKTRHLLKEREAELGALKKQLKKNESTENDPMEVEVHELTKARHLLNQREAELEILRRLGKEREAELEGLKRRLKKHDSTAQQPHGCTQLDDSLDGVTADEIRLGTEETEDVVSSLQEAVVKLRNEPPKTVKEHQSEKSKAEECMAKMTELQEQHACDKNSLEEQLHSTCVERDALAARVDELNMCLLNADANLGMVEHIFRSPAEPQLEVHLEAHGIELPIFCQHEDDTLHETQEAGKLGCSLPTASGKTFTTLCTSVNQDPLKNGTASSRACAIQSIKEMETADTHEQFCAESLSKEMSDLEQAEFELLEQVSQDGFVRSNSDGEADAGAVTTTVGCVEKLWSLRLAKARVEKRLLVAKAMELAAVAMVPQDSANRPECSCGASLALEAAFEQGAKLKCLLRETALKLELATRESEQLSSNINVVKETLQSVMLKGGQGSAVKKVTKLNSVFGRLYEDALLRREKACATHHPVPRTTGHSGKMADLLPNHTDSQASKPSGRHSADAPNYHSPPSPGLANKVSLPSRGIMSVGVGIKSFVFGSPTESNFADHIGTRSIDSVSSEPISSYRYRGVAKPSNRLRTRSPIETDCAVDAGITRAQSAQAPSLMSPDSGDNRGVGNLSPHRELRTLSPTDNDCAIDVGTTRLQSRQSMSLTLHPHASTDGSKTSRGSRRESIPALAPVRPRTSPPQGKKSEVAPRLRRSPAQRLSDPVIGPSSGGPPLAITRVLHSPPF